MKKLNFLHKILIASITLSTANFVLADDKKTENNLNLDSLVIEKLPHLNAQKKVSVAGLSSGGFMAVQYQIAYSKDISAAAIIAGGPYYCAENNFRNAMGRCTLPKSESEVPSVEYQQKIIKNFADKNLIDDPKNLQDQRIWLFSSKNDKTVYLPVMQYLNNFYNSNIKPNNKTEFVISEKAGHAWITTMGKNACETHKVLPHINNCDDLDLAESYLKFFFPNQVSNDKDNPKYNTDLQKIKGRFIKFSQKDLQQKYNIQNAEMADEGFAFIPTKCESSESIKNVACSVHFVLHGCNQNLEISGDKFIYQTGVWRYADKYNLIVVYPITKTSAKNPFGCWDWFGYTGENYATKLAPQLQTFDAISKELQSK